MEDQRFKAILGYPRPSLKIYKRTQELQDQVLDVRLTIGPHWREGFGQDTPVSSPLETQVHRGCADVTGH